MQYTGKSVGPTLRGSLQTRETEKSLRRMPPLTEWPFSLSHKIYVRDTESVKLYGPKVMLVAHETRKTWGDEAFAIKNTDGKFAYYYPLACVEEELGPRLDAHDRQVFTRELGYLEHDGELFWALACLARTKQGEASAFIEKYLPETIAELEGMFPEGLRKVFSVMAILKSKAYGADRQWDSLVRETVLSCKKLLYFSLGLKASQLKERGFEKQETSPTFQSGVWVKKYSHDESGPIGIAEMAIESNSIKAMFGSTGITEATESKVFYEIAADKHAVEEKPEIQACDIYDSVSSRIEVLEKSRQ